MEPARGTGRHPANRRHPMGRHEDPLPAATMIPECLVIRRANGAPRAAVVQTKRAAREVSFGRTDNGGTIRRPEWGNIRSLNRSASKAGDTGAIGKERDCRTSGCKTPGARPAPPQADDGRRNALPLPRRGGLLPAAGRDRAGKAFRLTRTASYRRARCPHRAAAAECRRRREVRGNREFRCWKRCGAAETSPAHRRCTDPSGKRCRLRRRRRQSGRKGLRE